jgi:hypothetical protein
MYGEGVVMSLAVICLVTWFVIVVFALVPKRLTLIEMVFIYFVCSILTVTLFTIFDINLNWVPASRNVEKAIALNICRFIEIPLLLILSTAILNSSLRARIRWLIAAFICLFLTVNDFLLTGFGILVFNKWNNLIAFFDYGMFIILMGWIGRWQIHLKEKELNRFEH